MSNFFKQQREKFKEREKYTTNKRGPFFQLAGEYLPKEKSATVVDIGCGYAQFAKQLNLYERYPNLALLDGNPATVSKIKGAELYRAPNPLPFSDTSVDYIHCSHMIEHLYHEDLYRLLTEINRVLRPGGVLVVSAPLLWERFFNNLTHIKPYAPTIFMNYLCRGDKDSVAAADPTSGVISYNYSVEHLQYRYIRKAIGEETDSRFFLPHLALLLCFGLLNKSGIKRYTRNGYTLVLRKGIEKCSTKDDGTGQSRE